MNTGQKIRTLRKEKGLTQKKLAELSGLATITIQQYEASNYNPKIESLKKIADALGVHVSEFLETMEENERVKATWEWIQDNDQKRKELIMEILRTHNYKFEPLGLHAMQITDYQGYKYVVRNKAFDDMFLRADKDIRYNIEKLLDKSKNITEE
ncbi:Helix-turn-helix [Anaerocolumna xylanovorans DSM 12503]|uniref:Helix-turn-helix n=2 Tax=Anaerocolumna TaxID=1843210 RepID=A0A1M7Y3S0_9FIRM|nr:Helix-turn-helix [Anaerocolumna xylanovorans DSM 12503]